MPKFQITVSEREQEWSRDNEPLQSFSAVQSGGGDTPGFGRGGAISPLAD